MQESIRSFFKKTMCVCCGLGMAAGIVMAKPAFAEPSDAANGGVTGYNPLPTTRAPAAKNPTSFSYSLDFGSPAGPRGVLPTMGKGHASQKLDVFENRNGTLQKVGEIKQGSEIEILTTTHFGKGETMIEEVLTADRYAQIQRNAGSPSASKFLFQNNKKFAVVFVGNTSYMVPLSGVSLSADPGRPSTQRVTPDTSKAHP